MGDYEEVSLETLTGGAMVEKFNNAIKDVLENIFDPNVEHNVNREIHLIVKCRPSPSDPQEISYSGQVKLKLAQPIPVDGKIFGGTKDGQYVAYEQNVNQGDLFDEPEIDEKTGELKHINGGKQ